LSGKARELVEANFEGKLSFEFEERVAHSRGGYFAYVIPSNTRAVDAVIYAESEEDVIKLVDIAKQANFTIIPRGGGTNVSNMLEVPHKEPRAVVSLDMTRMCNVLDIDTENQVAHIEAGANGRLVEQQLNAQGFTMGHEPDSYEFSTLGGWISTAASGMKRTKYGNIEDIVVDSRMVTANGLTTKKIAAARYAHGPDMHNMLFGSEGNYGVITSAFVKVHKMPEMYDFDSFVFKTWQQGTGFLRESYLAGCTPTAMRLVDNSQFRFGHALKPEKKGLKAIIKSKIQTFAVTKVYGFDPLIMCAATMKYEGSPLEILRQKGDITEIATKWGGVSGGAEGGRTGYNVTMAIAYIGDFLLQRGVIGETFETCAPWNKIDQVIRAAKNEAAVQHKERNLPGKEFISSRVTQQYHDGVCIYFTYGYYHGGMDKATETFEEIYFCLKNAVVAAGGAVSHHHGIGKLRKPFMNKIMDETSQETVRAMKRVIDPDNIFAAGNNAVGEANEH